MTDVKRPRILYSILKFRSSGGRWPSFTATIEFRCCNRSRDVGHTQIVFSGLENVGLAFGIFTYHLPFGFITSSGLRRLLSTSGIPRRRATSVLLPLHRTISKMDAYHLDFFPYHFSFRTYYSFRSAVAMSDFCKSCRLTYFSYFSGRQGAESTTLIVRIRQI